MKLTKFILIGILLLATVLRFYKLDEIPHGLYIDEVSIGSNAYTILTEGVDEHGVTYPLFFKAFGEYKLPVEIYLTSVSMAVFGKNEFAVRFPSALFGVLSILFLYLIVWKLSKKFSVALLSAFFLAIAPWHIQFSRGGFEANTALFFYLLGGFLYLQFLTKKKYVWLLFSIVALVVTMYTYNAYKLIAPITLVAILSYYVIPNPFRNPQKILKQVQNDRFKFGMTIAIIVLLSFPIFLFSEGSSRFLTASAFGGRGVFAYPIIYLQNYFSFFSLPFLFATGDGFGRHSIVGMGPLFRFELPLLLLGLFALFKQRKTFFAQVIFFLLLVAPVTAALTQPSPHQLRSFLLVIPLTVLIAYGLVVLWEKKSKVIKALVIVLGLIAVYEAGMYLHLYYTHYPMRTAPDWGLEYKAIVMTAGTLQKNYETIVINTKLDMSPRYIDFYNGTFAYQFVDATWQKPKDASEKILYITTNEKDDTYLQTIPHKHIQDIRLKNLNNDIVAQFWEI